MICSDGSQEQFLGVAPGCKLVPVRVIDGPALINENWLAMRSTMRPGSAEVISCSWNGPEHADVVTALNETSLGRNGKAWPYFAPQEPREVVVEFPAWHAA